MGFFDSIKNALGGDKNEPEGIKGPSMVLREAGIDPSGLDFKIGGDSSITVTGTVADETTRDRITTLIGDMKQVTSVNNQTVVAKAAEAPAEVAPPVEPEAQHAPQDEPQAEAAAPPESPADAAPEAGETYTVQSGDSLWKIAEAHYGNGSKYQAIFEANRDILDNPDLIKPGQVLKLPTL